MSNNPLHNGRIVDTNDKDCLPGETGELIWNNRDEPHADGHKNIEKAEIQIS